LRRVEATASLKLARYRHVITTRIALANGLTTGTLSPTVFNAALNRVLALRSSLGS